MVSIRDRVLFPDRNGLVCIQDGTFRWPGSVFWRGTWQPQYRPLPLPSSQPNTIKEGREALAEGGSLQQTFSRGGEDWFRGGGWKSYSMSKAKIHMQYIRRCAVFNITVSVILTFPGVGPLGKKCLKSFRKGCNNKKFQKHWPREYRFCQKVCI